MPSSRVMRLVDWVNSVGRVQGERLGLSLRLRVWRSVRPAKAAEGTEVKLLRPRKAVLRAERLAREGMGPEMALFWSEREVSCERELRSEGSVPVREREARLMVVTRLEESHLMPSHWQNGVVDDQSEGGGERDLRSLDMTAASSVAANTGPSSAAMMMVMEKRSESVERESRVFG